MELKQKSGLNFDLGKDVLEYDKAEFLPAVDWVKKFEDAQYAYTTPESDQEIIYFGARYMEQTTDRGLFEKFDLMADATAIKPGQIGAEYVKTVGHYHGYKPGTNVAYPEVYEAVAGQFEYLLQSEPDKNGEVEVIWVVAEEGDKVVMPPGYGHVSMNVGKTMALEIDIQKRDNPNQSDYSMFKEKVGGAFYRTADGLQKNPEYKIKSLRIVRPLEVPEWGLLKNTPLYQAVIASPEKFDFLTSPENYKFDLTQLFEDIEL